MQLILISGLAGAGKSTALKTLEDLGYHCIDNLTPGMLIKILDLKLLGAESERLAVSIDIRSQGVLSELPYIIEEISLKGISYKFIYLDAQSDVLIKRFSETRRKHPLSNGNQTIIDCINQERDLLWSIASIAHHIDTTNMTSRQLKAVIREFVNSEFSALTVVLQSFGFKYGVPIDSDFVFDVRCLPNPFYDVAIREYTGLEEPIIKFLSKHTLVNSMIDDISSFLVKWLCEFNLDSRSYITISIGCTGGMHRSVYVVEQLSTLIAKLGYKLIVRHRQILEF